MTWNGIQSYNSNPALNTLINGISLAYNCPPGDIRQAIQQMMADLAGGAFIQTGMLTEFAGPAASIPFGYLYCDGSAVSRTTYANLFTAIGTTHGAGDGSTTFNLPDFRGAVAIGQATANNGSPPAEGAGLTSVAVGVRVGAGTVALTQANLPNITLSGTTGTESATHSHAVLPSGGVDLVTNTAGGSSTIATGGVNPISSITNTQTESATHTHNFSTPLGGSATPISTYQPSVAILKLIKT